MLDGFKLEEHQFREVEERVQVDRQLAQTDPSTILWDAAFEIAYRIELGNRLLSCPEISRVTPEAIRKFFNATMTRAGHVIGVDGANKAEITDILKCQFPTIYPKLERYPQREEARYWGGEQRVPYADKDGRNHVLIAFGTAGTASESETRAAEIMKSLIGGSRSVDYGERMSHFPTLRKLLQKTEGLDMNADVVSYSNGGLLGIQISAPSSVSLKPIIESLCQELRNLASNGSTTEALTFAKAQAGGDLAWRIDSRVSYARQLALSLLHGDGRPFSLLNELQKLQAMSTSEFKTMTTKILSRKPVYVSLGNLRQLPYSDEILF